MAWGMMSEYILGDGFESGGGDSGEKNSGGVGCLIALIVLGLITWYS